MVAWPGNGDEDWNTAMAAYVAVEHNTDGTHSIHDGNSPTVNDSESNAMLKAHAYLAQTSGFVNAYATSAQTLKLYVGATDDPAGAGTVVAQTKVDTVAATRIVNVFAFVPNGEYFEIVLSTETPTITWTALETSGAAPVDQD